MKATLVLLTFLCLNVAFGQPEIILSLLPNSGGDLSNEEIQLSYSLGEPVVGFSNDSGTSLNQGIQQSFFQSLNSSSSNEIESIGLKIYPNPFFNQIIVSHTSTSNLDVKIFDVIGHLVHAEEITSNPQMIDLKELNSGVYYLKTISDKKVANTISVIKF